jgi:hypothetical protein
MTIVGVVNDTRASGLDSDVRPYLYVPFWVFAPDSFAVTIRAEGNLGALVPAVKREVWRVDKDQPVTHVEEMTQVVADSVGSRWFQFVLMAIFGVFAVTLAAIGIYGVLSYAVAQRTREIGIRLALGASRSTVVGAIMRQAALLAGLGATVGVVAAWLLVPVLRAVLYRVAPLDPRVFLGAVLVLLAVASLAGLCTAVRSGAVGSGINAAKRVIRQVRRRADGGAFRTVARRSRIGSGNARPPSKYASANQPDSPGMASCSLTCRRTSDTRCGTCAAGGQLVPAVPEWFLEDNLVEPLTLKG